MEMRFRKSSWSWILWLLRTSSFPQAYFSFQTSGSVIAQLVTPQGNMAAENGGRDFNIRFPTTVCSLRPSYANVTLHGVNIQDHCDRGIDSTADRPFLGQVSEMTVVTSNPSAIRGFGYAHVMLTIPGGTNQYHGLLRGARLDLPSQKPEEAFLLLKTSAANFDEKLSLAVEIERWDLSRRRC